jgi:uncharacterized protein (TIGR03083 family)
VYLDAITRETEAFAAAVAKGLDAAVPSCPGWVVRDLAGHMGMIHRWVTHIVTTGTTDPVTWDMEKWGPPVDGVDTWLRDGAAALRDALDTIGPDQPVWTFIGVQRASFWSRRQAHETAVHRWDAEGAFGAPTAIAPDLAADGLDEVITLFVPRRHSRADVHGTGETVHVHRTDGPGEWLIRFGPDGAEVSREHARGDLALRGSAHDLLLWVWGRAAADCLELFGDAALLDRWSELVPAI